MKVGIFFTDRVRSTTEGYVFTGVCLLTGGYPSQVPTGYRGYLKVPTPPPSQGTYPSARPDGGGGTPRYLLAKVPTPSTRSDGGRGTPTKVPTLPHPLPPIKVPTLPPPPPRKGQHMEYSMRRGRYASCVHAGGLSCLLWVIT